MSILPPVPSPPSPTPLLPPRLPLPRLPPLKGPPEVSPPAPATPAAPPPVPPPQLTATALRLVQGTTPMSREDLESERWKRRPGSHRTRRREESRERK